MKIPSKQPASTAAPTKVLRTSPILYYISPNQYAKFAATGMDMSNFAIVEKIPIGNHQSKKRPKGSS